MKLSRWFINSSFTDGVHRKMYAIREEFEFDEHNSFGYGRSSAMSGYADGRGDYSDVTEIKQNVRNAMKEARRKITSLRLDVEEKENILQTERALRQQLEKELSEKSEELYRERMSKSGVSSTAHSPLNGSLDRYYGDSANRSYLGESPSRTLKEELSTTHQLNIQLTEKLTRAEAEVQAFKMSRDEIVGQTEAKIAARGAALVDKIYHAQKERDEAMNARLKLAHDEREELINRLRRLEREQTGCDSGVDSVYDEEDSESTLKGLLHRLTASESPHSIDKQGTMMVSRIKTVQKNKKRVVTEELRAVLAERDTAVEKARKLEGEVIRLQKELEMIKNQFKLAEKTRIKAAQAQLMSAQHERDTSVKKTKRLEEELETIRVYYSLHRSLSQEQGLRDQFNQTMDSFEERLRQRDGEVQVAQRSYDDVVAKLKSVTQERTIMSSQLQEAVKSQRQEKEKADKLERLVGVLRKRVAQSGGGNIPTVN